MENYKIYAEQPCDSLCQAEFFYQQSNSSHRAVCNAHIHNAVELLYVTEGSFCVVYDGITQDIEKGDLILLCSNTPHNVYTKDAPSNAYYVIKISPEFFLHFLPYEECAKYIMRFSINRKDQKNLWLSDELEGSEMLTILNELIKEDKCQRQGHMLSVSLKIAELLLAICRQDNELLSFPGNDITYSIYSVMEYVHKHYDEDLNEKELSRQLNISYSYFSRSFKQMTGISFKKYLNRIRINKAHHLLSKKEKSISDIAIECGYNSISYFISVYKAETGKTPYQTKLSVVSEKKSR